MKLKYGHLILIVIFLTLGRSGYASDLLVFAGAGMRIPLIELGENFTAQTGIRVVYDFDGSGRLGGKVLMGVKPDLFIPGSDKWALKLKDEGYVRECFSIAYHTPVIIRPKGNNKVKSLNDLSNKKNKIALGDRKACAIGRNNQRMFKEVGLLPVEMNVVARGLTVKQLVQWVESGVVDASIVWRADAVQSDRVSTIEIPSDINLIDRIPTCLMTQLNDPQSAIKFWNYLRGNGHEIFAKHGFQTLNIKL